ncbi:MAG: hypothetical protein WCG83_03215 [Candidatus Peregrinibacteria bacterium]
MKITEVFPLLIAKGIQLDPMSATQDICSSQEQIRHMRDRGREPPLRLENVIRDAVQGILTRQNGQNWWHSLKKDQILQLPEFDDYRADPGFDKKVNAALRVIAGEAAVSLWSVLNGQDFEAEFDLADLLVKEEMDQQASKLAKLAAWELGVSYAHQEPPAKG